MSLIIQAIFGMIIAFPKIIENIFVHQWIAEEWSALKLWKQE